MSKTGPFVVNRGMNVHDVLQTEHFERICGILFCGRASRGEPAIAHRF
jgi:hypothetical protein